MKVSFQRKIYAMREFVLFVNNWCKLSEAEINLFKCKVRKIPKKCRQISFNQFS